MGREQNRLTGIRIEPQGVGAEQARLDRTVLLMTIALWAVHFGILIGRSAATGTLTGLDITLVRVGVALAGMASTFGLYALLRRRMLSALRRFFIAALLSLPISLILAFLNETSWLLVTDYYGRAYGTSPAGVLSNPSPFVSETVFTAATFIWIYVCWCALSVGSVSAAEVRERDRLLASAEAATHEAQLMALRFQLNPHFLFNTLNTLSGLVALDRKDAAESMFLNLSQLLRHSLSGEPSQLTTLAEEVELQLRYLDIEKVRFAERLQIQVAIAPGCEAALVPPFLLQPLVENAIKHGVAPSEAPVTVTIRAMPAGSHLVVAVENGGSPGGRSPEPDGFGIGLANVRKRLAALYGDDAALECARRPDGGWRNHLRIPWREAPNDARIACRR